MKMQKNDLNTWNSQQSQINIISKLQNNFLQKFFRYNLIDYFPDLVTCIWESSLKQLKRQSKLLLKSTFISQLSFSVQQFQCCLHRFYKQNSRSFSNENDLHHVFKIRYCNVNKINQISSHNPNNQTNPTNNQINKGELIIIDVKIRIDLQKLQEVPNKIIKELQYNCRSKRNQKDQLLEQTFKNYNQQYINLFIVYFGDINFHLCNNQHYQTNKIHIFGNQIKLRIFVFYVSKQALLETFRTMNKITTLDHINDLVIQFYQLKRQKRKKKQIKKQIKQLQAQKSTYLFDQFFKKHQCIKYFAGGISVLAVSVIYYKLKYWN